MEQTENGIIILENDAFRLEIGADCIVKSLVVKSTGEECCEPDEEIAFFSVTQDRPFNNEVKLAHPNKRTTYPGNRVRREGDELIVGFHLAPYEARIGITVRPGYISFKLNGFIVKPTDYGTLDMDFPPAAVFRLIQIPVKHRENFGEWLNVVWDDRAVVNVLGTSPYTVIDSEYRKKCRILYADADRDILLKGAEASIISSAPDAFLDVMDEFEKDYGLPRGVQSRKGPFINCSAYWTDKIHPGNVDEHIFYAKKGGFRMMLIYYYAFTKIGRAYDTNGNYDFNDYYPNGYADLKYVLDKIKAAGIHPGIHFLHTHIGERSRYVTPYLDHRIHKTRLFTLSKPLGKEDDTVYVEENPTGSVMNEYCRVLGFGTEVIFYDSYTTEPPYAFLGCKRGFYDTVVTDHPLGEIGGILDRSEFGHSSMYIDQNTSLQDEIADKIGALYGCGFEYCYFDGSEGAMVPFGIHVSNAQYRVWKKLFPKPLYTEGAAKTHFDWHFLTGGNAFDVFLPEVFKEKIVEHPYEEAPRMRQDFTRLNFGWWGFWLPGETFRLHRKDRYTFTGTQADMIEYGTKLAAAWDCPATIQFSLDHLEKHPRTDDILEVMRRWEEVRQNGFLTEERKALINDPEKEHTLLINEEGKYEIVPYKHLPEAASGDQRLRAFSFKRNNASWIVFWHVAGEGTLCLPLDEKDVLVFDELNEPPIPVTPEECGILIPLGHKRYIKSSLTEEELIRAFENAVVRE
ncbi:MAG: hypothetical protein IK088_08540 [Lachnospiraceae bacterium]|nr:hypothetical protein [Lachnospiraceae bacterium]